MGVVSPVRGDLVLRLGPIDRKMAASGVEIKGHVAGARRRL